MCHCQQARRTGRGCGHDVGVFKKHIAVQSNRQVDSPSDGSPSHRPNKAGGKTATVLLDALLPGPPGWRGTNGVFGRVLCCGGPLAPRFIATGRLKTW